MDHSYPYIASLTREPFLFYEMRSTAKLMAEGNSDDMIVREIVEQNLFQYPTEKSITRMAKACIKRLHALEDDSLVSAIASQPTDVAKQICLYALMKQSRLVWEFMLTVIGEKYRLRDMSFGKKFFKVFNALSLDPITKEEIEKEANSIPEYIAIPLCKEAMNLIEIQETPKSEDELIKQCRMVSRIALREGIYPSAFYLLLIDNFSKLSIKR